MAVSQLDKLKDQAKKTVKRGLDSHLTLAVTGLSGSGKTAFISALVHHLTQGANEQNLPFFEVMQQKRHIATCQVPQKALDIPTFDHTSAMSALLGSPPVWPASTKRINTLRLAMRYRPESGIRAQFTSTSTLTIDLIDYPGEWLLDLPMLSQDYQQWSNAQLALLKREPRASYAKVFLTQLAEFDPSAAIDENQLNELAGLYQQVLVELKTHTHVAMLQPGRMLLPGDLAGAPLLAFFPMDFSQHEQELTPQSQAGQLNARYQAYLSKVVKPFYNDYFCRFDRQIVLVDLLNALNEGVEVLDEQAEVINQLLSFFNYGKSNVFKRLFSPKIDKLLFAANKSDHVSSEHHQDLALLLNDLVQKSANQLTFSGVQLESMAMSSVCGTQSKQVKQQGKLLHCVYGKPLNEENWLTYLPPQPPRHRLTKAQWPKAGFEFLSFAPLPSADNQLRHIRLDHVLQFLIGDKVK